MSNRFSRNVILTAAIAFSLSGVCLAQTAPASPPEATSPQRMTGAAAIAAIAGNTLSGDIDGDVNVMFFASDGRLTMLEGPEQSQGNWAQRGTQLCLLFEDEEDECYELEVTGEFATLREDATTSYRLNIAKGNAQNLPLAPAKK